MYVVFSLWFIVDCVQSSRLILSVYPWPLCTSLAVYTHCCVVGHEVYNCRDYHKQTHLSPEHSTLRTYPFHRPLFGSQENIFKHSMISFWSSSYFARTLTLLSHNHCWYPGVSVTQDGVWCVMFCVYLKQQFTALQRGPIVTGKYCKTNLKQKLWQNIFIVLKSPQNCAK